MAVTVIFLLRDVKQHRPLYCNLRCHYIGTQTHVQAFYIAGTFVALAIPITVWVHTYFIVDIHALNYFVSMCKLLISLLIVMLLILSFRFVSLTDRPYKHMLITYFLLYHHPPFLYNFFPISSYDLQDICQHLRHYNNSLLQRKIVRILWMVPIYAICSWLALRFKDIK